MKTDIQTLYARILEDIRARMDLLFSRLKDSSGFPDP